MAAKLNIRQNKDARLKIKTDSILDDITFDGVSKELFVGMVERLQEMLGLGDGKVKFILITDDDIKKWWDTGTGPVKFSSATDFALTKNANAFINNGVIYINTDKKQLDSPVHEFLHVALAVMKYNGNPNIRRNYFNILNSIVSNPEYSERYQELQKTYGKRRDSDIKEELLVEVLSNEFAKALDNDYFTLQNNLDGQISTGTVLTFIKDTISALFGMQIPGDINPLSIMKEDFRKLFNAFGTTLTSTDRDTICTTILPNDQRVREIKAVLFDRNYIKFNNECI